MNSFKITIILVTALTLWGCMIESETTTTTMVTKSDTVRLGSWNAAPPGCLDADSMRAHSSVNARAKSLEIDLCFFNEAPGGEFFMSPYVAAGQGHSPKDWPVRNRTQMLKVNVDFNKISTREEIHSLWVESSADLKVETRVGQSYLIKTDKGAMVLIYVVAKPITGNAAQIIISGKK